MKEINILIIDDEEILLSNIKDYLEDYPIKLISDPVEALAELKENPRDIVIADYKMPGMTGIELLVEARKIKAYTYGILFTAYADKTILEHAINKNIVSRFIEKPLKLKQFKEIVDEAIKSCRRIKQQEEKARHYDTMLEEMKKETEEIIGLEAGLQEVFAQVKSVAPHEVGVLLTGETGTGKEVMAKLIHNLSDRKEYPFITVNCAAIPENLLESELFGYKKGAFSGAITDKPGRLEIAHKGTLFLDEIGDMKPDLQVKLLRVLQEKKVTPLGGMKEKSIDFRLIAATNKDLLKAIEEKAFREDLYYRINTFPIKLPALKQRKEDISSLVRFYTSRYCREMNIKEPKITEGAIKALTDYSWRGNIRELKNAVKRALIISYGQSTITKEDYNFLFLQPRGTDSSEQLIETIKEHVLDKRIDIKELEKQVLNAVLDHCNGSKVKAAKITGISRAKFYRIKEDEDV